MRFLFPPGGAIPLPGSARFSRQAGGRIAFSAPCRTMMMIGGTIASQSCGAQVTA
jgi:hypothetical protein